MGQDGVKEPLGYQVGSIYRIGCSILGSINTSRQLCPEAGVRVARTCVYVLREAADRMGQGGGFVGEQRIDWVKVAAGSFRFVLPAHNLFVIYAPFSIIELQFVHLD